MPLPTEQRAADIVVLNNYGAMDARRLLATPEEELAEVFSSAPSVRRWIDPQLSAVYVISNEANSLLKIGHADNLKHRFAGMNVGSPVEIELRHFLFFVGRLVAKSVESAVHGILAAHRVRGEWFDVDLPTAAQAVASVATDRKLAWWTETERRALGHAAIEQDAKYWSRKNFFLRN